EPGGHRHAADVVVTPARVTVHEGLGARRAFGLQAQLYSVRSPRSWGIGDLADMRDLAAISGARHGADFLLVNPLHASYPTSPIEPSPYLPTTRRFTSALYLRIEDVPEHRQLPDHARQRIALLKKDVEGWNSRVDRLEREGVLDAKLDALEEQFPGTRPPAHHPSLHQRSVPAHRGRARAPSAARPRAAADRTAEEGRRGLELPGGPARAGSGARRQDGRPRGAVRGTPHTCPAGTPGRL